MDDRKTILIVDSDLATQVMYQRALQVEFDVLLASTEPQALAQLAAQSVEAIVLELGLVDKQGWNLLAKLQRQPNTRAIPVVVCTTQDHRRRGLEMGAAAYLLKPVLPKTLLATLLQLVA